MKAICASILIAFAASVNACISFQGQACIDSLADAQSKLDITTGLTTSWTIPDGYVGFLNIHTAEQNAEDAITQAGIDCCHQLGHDEDEALAIIDQFSIFATAMQNTLHAFGARKPDFDQTPLLTGIISADINNIKPITVSLDTCLLNALPVNYTTEVQVHVDVIDAAFDDVSVVYGL